MITAGRVAGLIQAMDGGADPAVIKAAVQDWLDAHPEATTTVADESITKAKLAEALQYKVNNFHTYYAELDRWQIPNNGTNAQTTTANINSMIAWAKTNGFNAVCLPAGTYLIHGINDNYSGHQRLTDAGIVMPDDMALLLCDDTILQVETNGYQTYSCITFHNKPGKNILIKGGKILGDRKTHDFSGESGSHEYGYGVLATACENVVIDGVYFDGFTGDALMISNTGNAQVPETYYPAVNVKVLNCTIKNSCRNNISITGCDNVTVAGCYIIGAGTADDNHDGIAPRFGIDVEGYGEGDRDLAVTRRINVICNVFEGNVNSSCDFFTGYECVAIGNISDNQFGYSYGNNIVIANNVFYKGSSVATGPAAIGGSGVSQGFDGNYTIISGNEINGFSTGVHIRGENVFVIGNRISNAVYGISTYECSNCEIISNVVEKCSKNGGTNEPHGLHIGYKSSSLIIKSNVIRNSPDAYSIRISYSSVPASSVYITDNDVLNNKVGMYIESGSDINICNNRISGMDSNWGAIALNSAASNVDICGNTIKNSRGSLIDCSLGNASSPNRLRIRNNTLHMIDVAQGIIIGKPVYADIVGNTFICEVSNNTYDCIIITSDPLADTTMNRILSNLFYSENNNGIRYAIRAQKGGSLIAWNHALTGAIIHHADDALIDNYPAS